MHITNNLTTLASVNVPCMLLQKRTASSWFKKPEEEDTFVFVECERSTCRKFNLYVNIWVLFSHQIVLHNVGFYLLGMSTWAIKKKKKSIGFRFHT